MRQRWNYIPYCNGESRYARCATTGPELLSSRLALAIEHGIAFHDALLSLTIHGKPLMGAPWRAFFKFRNWDFCLCAAACELKNGRSLGYALQRLRYFLPEFYLAAIAEAERNGTLAEVLPAFAESMRFSAGFRHRFLMDVSYPLVELLFILPIISSLFIFIIPKFNMIMVELLEGQSSFYFHFLRQFQGMGHLIFQFLIVLIFLFFVLRRFHWEVMSFLEIPLRCLPTFRRQLCATGMMELAVSMQASLRGGRDIVEAVEFSRNTCRQFWLRSRLKRCGQKLDKGMAFDTAWKEVAGNAPINEFFVDYSLDKDALISGFAAMADWNKEQSLRASRFNSLWIMLVLLAINVSIVFCLEYLVFKNLIAIIDNLSNKIW